MEIFSLDLGSNTFLWLVSGSFPDRVFITSHRFGAESGLIEYRVIANYNNPFYQKVHTLLSPLLRSFIVEPEPAAFSSIPKQKITVTVRNIKIVDISKGSSFYCLIESPSVEEKVSALRFVTNACTSDTFNETLCIPEPNETLTIQLFAKQHVGTDSFIGKASFQIIDLGSQIRSFDLRLNGGSGGNLSVDVIRS